jgi:hypothetical protein
MDRAISQGLIRLGILNNVEGFSLIFCPDDSVAFFCLFCAKVAIRFFSF